MIEKDNGIPENTLKNVLKMEAHVILCILINSKKNFNGEI